MLTIICTTLLIFTIDLSDCLRTADRAVASLVLITLSKTISNLVELLPLVILVGTITTFSILGKKNEMVALSGVGVSNQSITSMMMIVVGSLYLIVILIVLPINKIITVEASLIRSTQITAKISEKCFFKASRVDQNTISNIVVWELDEHFKLIRTIAAEQGCIASDHIILYDPISRYKGKTEAEGEIKLTVSLDNIQAADVKPQAVNLIEIPDIIRDLSAVGLQTVQYERHLWINITSIVSMMLMCWLGFDPKSYLLKRSSNSLRVIYCLVTGVIVFFISNLIITVCLSREFSVLTSVSLSKVMQVLTVLIFKKAIK